jgi:hypothetical protein
MKRQAGILALLIVTIVAAQDTTTWSLQLAYVPDFWTRSLSFEAGPYNSNSFELGVRVQPAAKLSVDLMGGAVYLSGYDSDSASFTQARPSVYSAMVKLGVVYDLYYGDRSRLGALLHVGLNYDKTIITDYNDYSLESYKQVSPFAFLGVEPTVLITKNVSFFTRIGAMVRYNPATKENELYMNYGSGAPSTRYTIVDKKNSSATISLEGFCIGIRYSFRTTYFD